MQTQSIALTRAEARTIARRALLEFIEGRPGIWSHLKERMRPYAKNRSAAKAPRRKRLTAPIRTIDYPQARSHTRLLARQ